MLKRIQIQPGLNRESTQYVSGPSWYDVNNVRWRTRAVESIGGWVRQGEFVMDGIGRGIHSWIDFQDVQLQCVGTMYKYYLISGTNMVDITPVRTASHIVTGTVSTEDGTSYLTIVDSDHELNINDYVLITAFAGGDFGGINVSELVSSEGGYPVSEIVSPDSYKILIDQVANLNASSGVGDATVIYQITSGNFTGTTGGGYGAGFYGGDDYFPTEYSLSANPINTVGLLNFKVDIAGSGVTAAAGDYFYFKGFTGTINTLGSGPHLNTSIINDQWCEAIGVAGDIVTFVAPYQLGLSSGASGGGSVADFLHYDASTEEVSGATRGWGDVSTTLGLIIGGYRTVTIANFGEDLMFANRGGPIYYYDTSAKTSGGIPEPGQVAVTLSSVTGSIEPPVVVDSFLISNQGHTIAFACNDIFATQQNKMLIRWSDRNNPFVWEPTNSNEAGGQALRHGSELMGGVATKKEIMVASNSALYSMRYVGFPNTYGIDLITENLSLLSRNAAVAVDNSVYFMANDQFYRYDGSIQPLSANVLNYVFDNLNISQKEKIVSGVNSKFSEVIWLYPGESSFENDRYVTYNYANGTWSAGTFDMLPLSESAGSSVSYNRTAWHSSQVISQPLSTYILQYDPTTSPVTAKSAIMIHESGASAQGALISSYAETGEVELSEGSEFSFYSRILPDAEIFDRDSSAANPTISISLMGRDLPGRNQNTSTGVTLSFAESMDSMVRYTPTINETAIRGRSRMVSMKVSTDHSGYGWRLGDVRIELRPDGEQ